MRGEIQKRSERQDFYTEGWLFVEMCVNYAAINLNLLIQILVSNI